MLHSFLTMDLNRFYSSRGFRELCICMCVFLLTISRNHVINKGFSYDPAQLIVWNVRNEFNSALSLDSLTNKQTKNKPTGKNFQANICTR